jgi:hypothetical protein
MNISCAFICVDMFFTYLCFYICYTFSGLRTRGERVCVLWILSISIRCFSKKVAMPLISTKKCRKVAKDYVTVYSRHVTNSWQNEWEVYIVTLILSLTASEVSWLFTYSLAIWTCSLFFFSYLLLFLMICSLFLLVFYFLGQGFGN